ncbi:MAG TPA: hypothetical protein PKE39_11660 [Ignavibacteria bacterium]|nr:hypothetical protein [Ignavibacteria bacterium]
MNNLKIKLLMIFADRNISTKKVLQNYSIYLILFPVFLFLACKEDPTSPNPPPVIIDTVDRYEWSMDTIYGYAFNNLYVADSSNIFITSPLSLVYYNGETYSSISINDPDFRFVGVKGFDKNNVFAGGNRVNSSTPVLKKVENTSVSSYDITGDTGGTISGIFVEGPNQSWLSISESNTIYFFNSGLITPYTLDSGVRSGGFFRDSLNILYYIGMKLYPNDNFRFYIYEYINDYFNLVNIDSINTISELYGAITICGSDFIAMGRTSIYYFTNDRLEKLCNTPNFLPIKICGSSKNHLVCYGQTSDITGAIFTWDGEKWHEEKSQIIPDKFYYAVRSTMVNGRVNIIISDNFNLGRSYHLKGVPKK